MIKKMFLYPVFAMSMVCPSLNGQDLSEYYANCLSSKTQSDSIIQMCERLENLLIEFELLKDKSPEAYLILSENIENKELNEDFLCFKKQLKVLEIKHEIEIDLLYYQFLECMYLAIVERSTPLDATNFIHYETIKEMNGRGFSYANIKAMIKYAANKKDFQNISHRIPIFLGVFYYLGDF